MPYHSEAEQEAMEDEAGAVLGDPRRCPVHPHIKTSSPDGMFDAPCSACEMEADMDQYAAETEPQPDDGDDRDGFYDDTSDIDF